MMRDPAQPRASRPAAPSNGAAPSNRARELRLNVSSDPANVASVRRACEAFCRDCGLGETAAGEVGLCVNEAMANITRHAYCGATDRPVAVTGKFDGSSVHFAIRDWGSGVNPAAVPHCHDPLKPGGLGLLCLQRLMDDVRYTPQPDGMLLTMTRKKSPSR